MPYTFIQVYISQLNKIKDLIQEGEEKEKILEKINEFENELNDDLEFFCE